MTGKPAAEYSFTKSNQAITFSAKSFIKVDGKKIQVDPQLLFHHLIIVSQYLDDMSAIFKYELCSYPPSLFDLSLMLPEAYHLGDKLLMLLNPQKLALADAIWAKLPSDATVPKGEVQYVLDGGVLLHRIPWP